MFASDRPGDHTIQCPNQFPAPDGGSATFEMLYGRAATLARRRDGLMPAEREVFLRQLADEGTTRNNLLIGRVSKPSLPMSFRRFVS